jgi:hypothetical protein
LVEAFKINNSASVTGEPDSLIDIFKSFDANNQCERSRLDSMKASSSVSAQNAAAADAKTRPEESKPMVISHFSFVFVQHYADLLMLFRILVRFCLEGGRR